MPGVEAKARWAQMRLWRVTKGILLCAGCPGRAGVVTHGKGRDRPTHDKEQTCRWTQAFQAPQPLSENDRTP